MTLTCPLQNTLLRRMSYEANQECYTTCSVQRMFCFQLKKRTRVKKTVIKIRLNLVVLSRSAAYSTCKYKCFLFAPIACSALPRTDTTAAISLMCFSVAFDEISAGHKRSLPPTFTHCYAFFLTKKERKQTPLSLKCMQKKWLKGMHQQTHSLPLVEMQVRRWESS